MIPTIPAADIFDPVTGLGAARGAIMGEAQTWGTEVETEITEAEADIVLVQADADLALARKGGLRDRLLNGAGRINQRVATAPTDDTYAWDRHYVLTQTAAIGVSTLSNVADGLPSMMRMTQSQATAQRMGVAQIIESANCIDLRGKLVTLVGKLRCSSAQAIRYAILEWTGTADAVTSDVVNNWANGTFTAGNFFVSTTTTVRQVGTLTPTANTVTDFALEATLGSSLTNIIVLLWTEGTAAQNVTLDLAWEFVEGSTTGQTYPIDWRPYALEFAMCQRYYRNNGFTLAWTTSTTALKILFAFEEPMFAAPTAALISGTAAAILIGTGTRDISAIGATFSWSATGGELSATIGTTTADRMHAVVAGKISLSAEL